MSPSKIKALLTEREILQTEIARDLGISDASVSMVIKKRSRSYRVEKRIADLVGIPYEKLWGSEPRRKAA